VNSTSIIGIIAGVLTSLSLLPQLIKILKEKQVEDISAGMFITLTVGLALWVVYGFLKQDWPIILTNAFSVLVNIFIIILKFKYRNNRKE